MSLAENLPLGEAKDKLSEAVETAEREHARFTITKHGRPAAVLLSADDYASLQETLEVLSRSDLVAQIRKSLRELETERPAATSKDEFLAFAGTKSRGA